MYNVWFFYWVVSKAHFGYLQSKDVAAINFNHLRILNWQ